MAAALRQLRREGGAASALLEILAQIELAPGEPERRVDAHRVLGVGLGERARRQLDGAALIALDAEDAGQARHGLSALATRGRVLHRTLEER